MRIVVTGATGNIGTSVIEQLAHDEAVDSIVGVARRLPEWQPPKTRWVAADLAHDDLASLLQGADVVVHLAWIFQPTRDPLRTWRTNVLGSLRVFDAAAAAGVGSLVHASSVGAYAPGPQTGRVDESWPTHALPTAAYGREKSYLERVLDTFEHSHPEVRVVRLRPGFIFQRASASEQRRLFAGPLLPTSLVRSALVPAIPDLPGLRLQTLHATDAADAFRRAAVGEVSGAFNLAAEPIVDAQLLAELFDARLVRVPRRAVRAATAAAWHLHAIPASPQLLDLALSLPAMDTSRARTELGWEPAHGSMDALRSFLEGLQATAGGPTPPLHARAGGPGRWRELATGVGRRDRLERC
jgi:nucleoside-diphosphate-sugar epimerase